MLRNNLGDHLIFANSSMKNKSRTVAVIIHQSWSVSHVYRDPSGSLIGVVASRAGLDILFVSAYLPSNTDIIGYPDLWDTDAKLPTHVAQQEVHSIYSSWWNGRISIPFGSSVAILMRQGPLWTDSATMCNLDLCASSWIYFLKNQMGSILGGHYTQ